MQGDLWGRSYDKKWAVVKKAGVCSDSPTKIATVTPWLSGGRLLTSFFTEFMKIQIILVLITSILISYSLSSAEQAKAQVKELNGFKLSKLNIPQGEIRSGGPPRDGIPSIDKPDFIDPDKANFMKDEDLVLSYSHNGRTRAYPLRILVWHEIVNETIEGKPVLVTYCPLCGTAMIFDRMVEGKVRDFGVSGLLYQSDVLMYDREDESLWSQLKMEAVSGPLSGTALTLLPSSQLTWSAWKNKHPEGEVLSTKTGHRRHYSSSPYSNYFDSPGTMFPVPKHRDELPEKAWVVGVVVDGKAHAFPLADLTTTHKANHKGLVVTYDPKSQLATATGSSGENIPVTIVFWFAWQAFHPKTSIWQP